jgi:hypothetical protein
MIERDRIRAGNRVAGHPLVINGSSIGWAFPVRTTWQQIMFKSERSVRLALMISDAGPAAGRQDGRKGFRAAGSEMGPALEPGAALDQRLSPRGT